jgi:adenylosuccinate synthase
MIMDFQYGSTGKGLIAGYLANRNNYDTAICAFATNAGHTYINNSQHIEMMTQQLPTSIISDTVKNVMLGPGSAIHVRTLQDELLRYGAYMHGKRLMIHSHAAIVEDYHAEQEQSDGRTAMGSTAKGVGDAFIERIRRRPDAANVAKNRLRGTGLSRYVVTPEEYDQAVCGARNVIIEGAQGFSLSMYHGQYPYTTSRDVTPWQIAADCGLPFRWAPYIEVIGTLRTFPIRVNNRDGSSGPCYNDQIEIDWAEIGVEPELTTVTKLPRRIFTFSEQQLDSALMHCGGYWNTRIFLNFANYMHSAEDLVVLIKRIEGFHPKAMNPPKVEWIGTGPDDSQILTIDEFNSVVRHG